MTEPRPCVPDSVGLDVPSVARVYDYLLGGGHNFPVDRAVAERLLRAMPGIDVVAGWNRAFLRRAVLFMIEEGIDQFLDLGSGIPTVGNVHDIAQRAVPDSRVVYVDRDEVAVAHSELILAGDDHAAIVRADICEPRSVLTTPEVTKLLDLSRPVGLLMIAVLHFVPDERDPQGVVAAYRDALAPGSFLALTHVTADHRPAEIAAAAAAVQATRDQLSPRSYDQVKALFTGWKLVRPGVVALPQWRPELSTSNDCPARNDAYGGVARKV